MNVIYHSTGEMDIVIANESTFTFPAGTSPSPQFCVTIVATDDVIVEGTESFYFIMRDENPFDTINRNVTVAVVDNDGNIFIAPHFTLAMRMIRKLIVVILPSCTSNIKLSMHKEEYYLEFD